MIFSDLKEGNSEKAKEQLHNLCLTEQKLVFGNNIYEIYEKEIVKDRRLYGKMFVVRDTGIGMKEEELPKLFAAFERMDESRNRRIEGTGLGMNIVLELLRMMGTKLEVASTYGEGSVFSFGLMQEIYMDRPIGNLNEGSRELYRTYTYKAAFIAP